MKDKRERDLPGAGRAFGLCARDAINLQLNHIVNYYMPNGICALCGV